MFSIQINVAFPLFFNTILYYFPGGQNPANVPSTSDSNKNPTNSSASASSSSSSNTSNNSPLVSAQSPAGGASGSQRTFSEDVIRRLVNNGFSRHEVLEALTHANGDEQKALVGLLAKSLKF